MALKKRILILTADAGFGHRSAANAVATAMEEKFGENCQIDVVNPLEDKRAPFFLRDSQTDYDKVVRNAPELYRFGYDASDSTVPTAIMDSALTVLLYEVMEDLIDKYHPYAILTTYPLYQTPLVAVYTINRYYVPLITVVTDLVTVHRMWFNSKVDWCVVPTPLVRDLAYAYGIPAEKVKVTGIPVSPDYARDTGTREEIRARLGWRPDLPTVLAVGSRRVERLVDIVNVFNHFGAPLQVAAVAGKDQELYQKLKRIDWHIPVQLYEYVDNMPELMKASDLLVCKAGGLIVTEALASGLPMMLVDVIPGQETGNAEYVVDGGAGEMALSPMDALEVMSHWFKDGQRLLKVRANNARRLGQPASALNVADLLWEAAKHGPVNRAGHRIPGRTRLVDLLTTNHVPWKEKLLPEAKENIIDD